MANLIIPSRRLRQPQGAVRASSQWLQRGLVALFNPAIGFNDLARNNHSTGIVGSLITRGVGSAGACWQGQYGASDNYVKVPRTEDLSYTTGVTFEAVVEVNGFETYVLPYISGVISQYQSDSSGITAYNGPVLRFNPDAQIGNAAVPAFGVQNGATEYFASGSAQSANKILHLIGLYNGSNLVIWVNGEKTVGAAYSGAFSNHASNFISIGSDFVTADPYTNHNRALNGKIFFAAIYNRGLSDAEALDRFANPWGVFAPDRRVLYFDVPAAPILEPIVRTPLTLSKDGGVLDPTILGTGTPNASKFLRGDGTWQIL